MEAKVQPQMFVVGVQWGALLVTGEEIEDNGEGRERE